MTVRSFWHDLRIAARMARGRPGFTAVVVATLALGIGVSTAIFSLIHGALLRPMPYPEADRLVRVQSVHVGAAAAGARGVSLPDVEDFRADSRTLEAIGAYTTFDAAVLGDGPPQAIKLTQLNPAALASLGVAPILGRLLRAEEDIPGGDVHKAVISHRLWRTRFGGDAAVLGRSVKTSLRSFQVVGVMPPGFAFPDSTDVWTTIESWYAMAEGEARTKKRDGRWYPALARLAPGVTVPQAQADLDRVAAALERRHPTTNRAVRTRLTPLRELEVAPMRPYLLLLFGAVLLVVLICCANVANLMLASAAARRREFAIRAALGASRWRQARALLTESLLLAVVGAAAGAALAHTGVQALLSLIPDRLPHWMHVEVDGPVLLFSLGLAAVTALSFGAAPAVVGSRVDVQVALVEGARGSARGARLRGVLVAAQVTLCLVLLVGAGLMLRSLIRLQRVEPGFAPENLLVARVSTFVPGTRAARAAAQAQRHERQLLRLRQLPGVAAAAATNSLPYSSGQAERAKADLRVKGRTDEELAHVVGLAGADVSSGYFSTMQIPLLRGRLFDARDTASSQMTVIVSQRAAERLWPGRDPIGQQLLWGPYMPADNPYATVVGVVGNVKHDAAEGDGGLELYYPHTQYPVTNAYYVVRTRGEPLALAAAVQRTVHETDPGAAIVHIRTMEGMIEASLWQRRLWAVVLALFAALALALAAIGIYGVLSYSVTQRRRELGIRLALGARGGDLVRLVIWQGMRMVAVGVALGVGAALALARPMQSLLFATDGQDAATIAVVSVVLCAVSLLACLVPALRAARMDPMAALRLD